MRKFHIQGLLWHQVLTILKGDRIENSCYNKGGFVFLYKNYSDYKCDTFPITKLLTTISKLAKLYLKEVDINHINIAVDSCWAVCQRDGDYGTLHNHTSPTNHDGKLFSGMIYLQIPAGISGKTFPDGCLHLLGSDSVLYIPPVLNSINIWPAEIVHGIHPFRGIGDRLGIAFNFIVT